MLDKQSKNTIKVLGILLLSVIVGEGGFGWGVYWPLLLTMVDGRLVYWLAFVVGLIVSSLYRYSAGSMSLFMVLVVGLTSLLTGYQKELRWLYLVISLVANALFDRVFGLSWSVWEALVVAVFWYLSTRWFEGTEAIRINY